MIPLRGDWAYYNDFDEGACAWLEELIREGLIAPGVVDRRSILDVQPDDLRGFTQVHFFAGIGGWSYALRLAGWPDDRQVWTGSPPCQPFSAAGRQEGRNDARHLAPHFIRLVGACRPGVLFGEQVASAEVFGKAASGSRKRVTEVPQWAWLDDLSDRLEAARYAVGASDFPSAGVGAPHIRQRTFFGAVSHDWLSDRECDRQHRGGHAGSSRWNEPTDSGLTISGLVDGQCAGLEGHGGHGDGSREPGWLNPLPTGSVAPAGTDGRMANSAGSGRREQRGGEQRQQPQDGGIGRLADDQLQQRPDASGMGDDPRGWQQEPAAIAGLRRDCRPSPLHGFWRDADWLFCRDGKWRPVEPGTFPLAHGVSDRVGLLRGYGNAINPHAAAQFIQAFDAATRDRFAEDLAAGCVDDILI